MRKWMILPAMAVAGACYAQSAYMPGEVLVRFRESSQVSAFAAATAMGALPLQKLGAVGVDRMRIAQGTSVESAVAEWKKMPFVEFAEPNYVMKASFTPNDPYVANQYALSKMSAFAGWDFGQGSSSVKIAIVDTGVDLDHPDLASKIVPGYDFVNNDSNADDDHGHGTHCAGIAAAVTNNGLGVAGVGFKCAVMPVKVLSASGSGSTSGVAAGITWAVDNGAKVVSLSLGGGGSSTLESAVNYAWSHGVIVVAAAGNSNTDAPSYPGYYSNAIAVGSTDQNDARSSFSNYGSWVDVAAPGSSILSCYMGGSYAYMSGTSMATPQVAGLAGLVWDKLGALTNVSLVRQKIEDNTDNVGTWLAKGRVNVQKSLSESAPPPPPPPPAQTVFPPSQMQIVRGSIAGGSLSNLVDSDDQRLSMGAVLSGRTYAHESYFAFAPTGTIQRLQFSFEGQTSLNGPTQLSVYNWRLNRWTSLGNMSMSASDQTVTYTLTSALSDYRHATNGVRIRALRSGSKAFVVRFDKMSLKISN